MDELLQKVASNIVNISLAVKPEDHFLIITDEDNLLLAKIILEITRKITGTILLIKIEDYGHRPILQVTAEMEYDISMLNPTASVLLINRKEGEETLTTDFLRLLIHDGKYSCRHVHIPNIPLEVMENVGSVSLDGLVRRGEEFHDKVSGEHKFTIRTGQDGILEVESPAKELWYLQDGIVRERGWKNFPDGEDEFYPRKINGTFWVAIFGSKFARNFGLLRESPVKLTIVSGVLTQIDTINERLKGQLSDFFSIDGNGNRVGECSFGFNESINEFTGLSVIDEKRVGAHLGFGMIHKPDQPGGYTCLTHLDAIGDNVSVWADGKQIIDKHKLLI